MATTTKVKYFDKIEIDMVGLSKDEISVAEELGLQVILPPLEGPEDKKTYPYAGYVSCSSDVVAQTYKTGIEQVAAAVKETARLAQEAKARETAETQAAESPAPPNGVVPAGSTP